jgi:hypothetical protein
MWVIVVAALVAAPYRHPLQTADFAYLSLQVVATRDWREEVT